MVMMIMMKEKNQAPGGPDGAAAELRAHLGLAWAVGYNFFFFLLLIIYGQTLMIGMVILLIMVVRMVLIMMIIMMITRVLMVMRAYLIIVIFFTLTQFLENKIYTEKRQFFALNL